MPTREEMHSLTQGIINSYEARVVGIASIREAAHLVRESTQAELRELYTAHQAMAHQQRTDLAKGRADLAQGEAGRKSGVNAWMKVVASAHQAMAHQQRTDLAQGEVGRKSGVNAWMKVVASAHAAAQDEWQKMATAIGAKRGVPAAKKAGAEVGPLFGDLPAKVFVYLADHPDGARMTELEKEFGVARIQMAKVVRHLTDENKVAKRDLVYFAI